MEIKFVSYTGEYPNLCCGILTLEIDGTIYNFGGCCNERKSVCFREFWESGGCVEFNADWEETIKRRKWKLKKEALPDFLKPYGKELIKVFNANVPYGCCGGCI